MRGSSDRLFPQAKILIDMVCSGEKVAVVSHLTLMETIHTLRRKIAENSSYAGNMQESRDAVGTEAATAIGRFVRAVATMIDDGRVLLYGPTISVRDYHAKVLDKLTGYFGYVRSVSICPHCKSGWVYRNKKNACTHCGQHLDSIHRYDYKGLGHADMEHVFLAQSYSVPEFYSGDRSFEDLRGDPDFKEIHFNTVTAPKSQ